MTTIASVVPPGAEVAWRCGICQCEVNDGLKTCHCQNGQGCGLAPACAEGDR
ncbi:hypothetical protein GCM10010406_11080 [Streptomyces thermolineatus]|uniref:Uncharacterized protein n=1 Tax=Streptomyces thermolineatus TaxID=44033 RepID=A0ABN3L656_9ACTN